MAKVKDLVAALRDLGVRISREDQYEVYGWCPGHEKIKGKEDTKPSWSINKESGVHHCFSCGYGGTLRSLAMDLQFPNDAFSAGRWVKRWGIVLMDADKLPSYFQQDPDFEADEAPGEVVITERSLTQFFSPPTGPLEERFISLEAAEFYEILWDVIEFGWIFPVREPNGTLLGWQFKNKRLFLNYPEDISKGHCVFGLEQLEEGQTAVVVESPLDCARMRTAGVLGGVSTMGVNFTDAQMRAILEKTDSVIWAPDNPAVDEAGAKSMREVTRGVIKYGKPIRKPWAPRFRDFRLFDYHGITDKDPGDMSDEDIQIAYQQAYPYLKAGLKPIDRTPIVKKVEQRRKSLGRR